MGPIKNTLISLKFLFSCRKFKDGSEYILTKEFRVAIASQEIVNRAQKGIFAPAIMQRKSVLRTSFFAI
ncbi:hypothetical protein SpAn4DRAFT_0003 [Sporomusa ovata]|uniref:Uncharacterized protein n=1 Tax=Sporomusa ovata TaxID=2378 RepID=A0A0U1L1L3_9FIRM|nr:hypothetical protein SpAn4DRAFT_0003 [Sporomusa ovata]